MVSGTTIRAKAKWLLFVWNTALAAGLFSFLVKYKLDIGKYFNSTVDIFSASSWGAFLFEKSEVLALGSLCLLSFLMLTADGRKWQEIGEGCFSSLATPAQWERVRGRHAFMWVVLSNVAIFIALPLFADKIIPFCVLMIALHLNGVIWILYMRKNIEYYFNETRFSIPSVDIHKTFIERQRKIVIYFMFSEHHLGRHVVVVVAGLMAILTAIYADGYNANMRFVSYVLLVAGVIVSEYMAFMERFRRDLELGKLREAQDEFDRGRG